MYLSIRSAVYANAINIDHTVQHGAKINGISTQLYTKDWS